MRGPEVGLIGAHGAQYLFDHIAFPGRADLGMGCQLHVAPNAEQRMQQAAITYINLGRLDLALADILIPGL
jgi:hypothetical protein